MNYCNYTSENLLIELIEICDKCSTKTLNSAMDLFTNELNKIIDSVKQSPNPNEQLKVITDTFNNVVYNTPGDPYCDYISEILMPKEQFNILINPEYNKQLAPTSSMSFEEVGKARKSVRSKNYLDKYFKKGNLAEFGDNGLPVNKLVVGMINNGEPVKNLTARQLLDVLEDEFKGMFNDKRQRTKFLIQVMKDWYHNRISKEGLLSVTHC
jgi:hypothetical protein